jgi:diphthamide synthase subunit DPH2
MTDYKTNINIILGGSPADKLKEVYKPVLTDTECSTNIGGAHREHRFESIRSPP